MLIEPLNDPTAIVRLSSLAMADFGTLVLVAGAIASLLSAVLILGRPAAMRLPAYSESRLRLERYFRRASRN